MKKPSETVTENIFREFYGSKTFLEKSAIDNSYGFKSKKNTPHTGYPDFFKDLTDFVVIVEAKALVHSKAEEEVRYYMDVNNITKNIIGIAISGQELNQIKVTYYYKIANDNTISTFETKDKLLTIDNMGKTLNKRISGETITDEQLSILLKKLNETFNKNNRVRDTDRSLFFSGLMIALTNDNFRNTYNLIQSPSESEVATTNVTILEAHYMNKAILQAIETQLVAKINNLSKEYSWRDQFSFIKNIDFSLLEYKEIITLIHDKIFIPYLNEEKQDILGKAYKIFLSRSGKIENKNIILTPDHIKSLMVKLARLQKNDVILDTCTGSGGFLMESMEVLFNLAKDDEETLENIRTNQLVGFELDPVLFALACSNMFLHGDGRSNLLFRNSLLYEQNEEIVNNKDAVLYEYIRNLHPTKSVINPPYEDNMPIKFTKQAIDYLESNGKLIIIMPTPTLTKNQQGGNRGITGLTEEILEVARLDFVIKMPFPLFSEQKRIVNTSIFGFTKTPHQKNDEVLFCNLEDDGFESIQHKGRVDKYNKWNDLENVILDAVNNSKEIENVSKKKKIYKDNVLNCAGFQDKRNSRHDLVRFNELFNTEKGTLQSSKNDQDGKYNFLTASDERKKHSSFDYDCEALVYAIQASGSLGKSQYIYGKFIASNLCLVLTPKENKKYPINLQFYNWYLEAIRKQIVADLADGTSKLTIGEIPLNNYYLEYIPIEEQNRFVKEHVSKYSEAKNELIKVKNELMDDLFKII